MKCILFLQTQPDSDMWTVSVHVVMAIFHWFLRNLKMYFFSIHSWPLFLKCFVEWLYPWVERKNKISLWGLRSSFSTSCSKHKPADLCLSACCGCAEQRSDLGDNDTTQRGWTGHGQSRHWQQMSDWMAVRFRAPWLIKANYRQSLFASCMHMV